MHHAARLRLVVNNSSSESSMPRSRAKRSRGKCHLPGMLDRRSHIKTAFSDSSGNSPESSERPPSLSMIETTPFIETDGGTARSCFQEQFVSLERNSWFSPVATHEMKRDNFAMDDSLDTKKAWKRRVFDRVFELVVDMGLSEDEFIKAFSHTMGFQAGRAGIKAAENAFGRKSLDTYYVVRFAREFGVEIAFLLHLRSDKKSCFDPHGKYAYMSENTELRRRLVSPKHRRPG